MSGNIIVAARLRAASLRKYYSAGLFAMVPVEVKDMASNAPGPIVGVDRHWRMYYDPEAVAKWTPEEFAGVLIHELHHLLRKHAGRAEAQGVTAETRNAWAVAVDLEINDDLLSDGLTLPAGALTPKQFKFKKGLFAEEYYRLLLEDEKNREKAATDGDGQPGRGDLGSGVTGIPEPGEQPGGAGKNALPAVKPHEAELIAREIARGALEHAGSGRGSLPAGVRRWAEGLLAPPKIDWRRELATLIRGAVAEVAGMVDYSYRRPGRRQAAMGGVITPALRRPVPGVAVVVDTSGSVDDSMLARAVSEVEGILKNVGAVGVQVLSCDAAVHAAKRVASASTVQLFGGGGTNMGAGLDAAGGLRPKPDVVVVLTDGDTPWPHDSPKGMRVVVGLLEESATRPPGWAKTVNVW